MMTSGVRDMQDVQIARHAADEREPNILHVVRVLWVKAVCERDQERIPGPGRKEEQEQDRVVELLASAPLLVYKYHICILTFVWASIYTHHTYSNHMLSDLYQLCGF